jgi:thiol-disulfide isomerase/thioredoxin
LAQATDAFQLAATAPSVGAAQRVASSLNYAGSATFPQPSSSPTGSPPSLRELLGDSRKAASASATTTTPAITTTSPSWAATAAAKREEEENDLASVIREINTLEDYERMIQQTASRQQQQQDTAAATQPLMVVRFHATYCAACKRAAPSFHRMVRKFVTSSSTAPFNNNNNNNNIQWVDVAVSKHNVDLQKHVGLKSIPSAFLYHPHAGLVEQLSINKNKLPQFQETLETYLEGKCPVHYTAEGQCL